ncbi:hypothetical protein DSL64_02465 [Dyadobacter luteus]|uniref:ISKra4 family transposase n=1 Tax=Dyadobacter luteus TaxID=2259619 RepID=A0A3D8YHX2_9BACT|nr:UPF0236 family protein [Dyadobacter luteus]REA64433.1 hypothetical protein DSL64_02465 [Dyadobacter luteus]
MALAGVSDVYSKSNELLNALLGINISESQLYRVTDYLGNAVAEDVMAEIKHQKLNSTERVYASMDGSMIQMDQGWQEVKLGRIFREDCKLENGTKEQGNIRYKLDESFYSGHLGSYNHFIPKFEASLGTYKDCEDRLVFITDGAQWIHNYLANRFPNATHILDYYHAVEHLTDFANSHFTDIARREKWVKAQKSELLEGSAQNVLDNIAKLRKLSKNVRKQRTKLLEYYKNNVDRMDYKSFRSQGLMIGNGPMEAAHRTVIQTRMKRSGQRWTPKGAQAMLNLRVLRESNRWSCVTQALSHAA